MVGIARGGATLVGLVTLLVSVGTATAQVPEGFQDNLALGGTGFVDAVAVRFAPDGRVFVAERGGVIKTFDSVEDTTPTVFADLSTNVYNAWDRGLLGLAIDPAWPAQPYVYVFYTYDATIGGTPPLWNDTCPDPPGFTGTGCQVSSRLSRLQAAGDVMTGPEQVLREGWCQQFPSHSVGDLAFGQDGALYLTHGDGAHFNFADYGQVGNVCNDPVNEGGALRCQDLETNGDPLDYHGCALRLDPATGAALGDNPLAGGVADDDPIIAYGLRNPYRFTIRPATNEIWIGDVGWGGFEEINRIVDPTDPTVENFGWPCFEGPVVQGAYDALDVAICENLYSAGTVEDPHYAYANTGNSITGVAFYTGGNYPIEYENALFFADFSGAWIRVMFAGPDGLPDPATLATFAPGVTPVDLTLGPDGKLYYVFYDRQGASYVRVIEYFPVNQPPIVVLDADPTSGIAPLTVDFDASASFDLDPNDTISFTWDLDADGQFDDGNTPTIQYTYTQSGSIAARVRVSDNRGAETIGAVLLTINNRPPVPVITQPHHHFEWRVGDPISFAGSATDPDTGALPASNLDWQIVLHHCIEIEDHEHDPNDPNHGHGGGEFSCHIHPIETFSGIDAGSFTAVDHEYPSFLEIKLTASDFGPPDWWDPAWGHRQQLVLNTGSLGETLTDFPVLVRLNTARTDYNLMQSDGADLRFTDANGQVLDHEIDVWNPSGESLIWVRLPSLGGGGGGEFIWMYLDNPAASDAQNTAGVWSNGYAGVWHLNDIPSGLAFALGNPSFDDNGGSLDGWVEFGNTFASQIDPRTGANHLKMYGQFNAPFNVSLVFQDLPANPGQTWELSSWVQHVTGDSLQGTSNFVTQKIEFFDEFGTMLDVIETVVADTSLPLDTYQNTGLMTRVAPAGTAVARAVIVFVQPNFESGAINVDDVVFRVQSPAAADFFDSTGNANNALDYATLRRPGVSGSARGFESGRSILIGSDASLEITGDMTLQAWIRPDDPNEVGPARLVSKKIGWDSGSGYELEYDAGANNFTVLGSGNNFGRATPVDLDVAWYQMTATISGGLATMYVDGQPVTTDPTVTPLAPGGEPLWFGQHGAGGNYFDGSIDEVRISSVARSQAWIATQHASVTDNLLTITPVQQRTPLSTTTSVEVQPAIVSLTLDSVPQGLELVMYSDSEVTPFWRTAIVFAETTLTATSPQVLDGERYEFVSWSNGGTQTQLVTVPDFDGTFTATFVEGCSSACDVAGNDADFDGDCDVDLSDLSLLLASFGATGVSHGDGDVNGDGVVNLSDLSGVLARFGEVCP